MAQCRNVATLRGNRQGRGSGSRIDPSIGRRCSREREREREREKERSSRREEDEFLREDRLSLRGAQRIGHAMRARIHGPDRRIDSAEKTCRGLEGGRHPP